MASLYSPLRGKYVECTGSARSEDQILHLYKPTVVGRSAIRRSDRGAIHDNLTISVRIAERLATIVSWVVERSARIESASSNSELGQSVKV